ncbi:murein L,D-transpeptidase [Solimonas sp. K1W22B-7]|uniref:L,D-transpeptidase family protein n=1 Tax=Solimonas sp. K1W22B-7 TaxID=2303331 RepID=UPI000E32D77D|nr:L,D-transpeptidase family protein [Solimonas sp. K1W22B-7]AXQ28463.1 murein L,D-transpeptidase [Solimonas sp. K1W22B-7]
MPQQQGHRLAVLCLAALLGVATQADARPAPEATGDVVSDLNASPPLQRGAHSAAVLRAQILIDRAHFPSGEIDAVYGSNMARAVAAWQKSRGLRASGSIDAKSWAELIRDNTPPLLTYRVSDADAAGPYQTIPEDMMEKAALPALGYRSAEEALAERFHIKPELLRRLNPDRDFARAGEEIIVPNVARGPLPAAAKVVVDRSDLSVSLVDAQGRTAARFPATIGSRHDPLPLGKWKIKGVARDPPFHYNPGLFWDAEAGHSKAKIAPGPNNPVGVVWIDLSKPHYGIHGTPEPGTIGKTQSHGCIRLANWDAAALAEAVKPGTPALLRR